MTREKGFLEQSMAGLASLTTGCSLSPGCRKWARPLLSTASPRSSWRQAGPSPKEKHLWGRTGSCDLQECPGGLSRRHRLCPLHTWLPPGATS